MVRTWTIASASAALLLSACGAESKEAPPERPPPVSPPAETWDLSALPDPGPVVSARTTPEGVRILVLAEGVGEPSTPDTPMDVHYVGYLRTGPQFDTGVMPIGGPGRVPRAGLIPGWRQGIEGMKPKERRRLLIPSAQAYGWAQPSPRMPPAADLVFDIRWTPFEYFDDRPGVGEPAREGDLITVHFVGRLLAGRVFHDTHRDDKREPVEMRLQTGPNQMIQGMFKGIVGMRPGGRRRITVPSHLAYGAQGNPPVGIPPNADLMFTVDLLEVRDPMKPR